ncbi:CLUMA_CG011288, isoform A [Clunio marinus]|uniref:CLUMA_CG011288, isoform A n=1 Tax=Clunio marinus TaxID=568069 RepID=A0A1J1IHI8_9DIPT|nr:CLUMA_CG011288, isoform A [Clunio marinus]
MFTTPCNSGISNQCSDISDKAIKMSCRGFEDEKYEIRTGLAFKDCAIKMDNLRSTFGGCLQTTTRSQN